MATKKKKNTAKKEPKNRVIKLTDNRTSALVSNYTKRVQNEFIRRLKDTNIPAAQVLAKDAAVLQNYFLNRKLNQFLLGDTILITDRVLRTSIASLIAAEIDAAIHGKEIVCPGQWSRYEIFGLIYAHINFATLTDAPEDGFFLSAHRSLQITEDEAAKYDAGTFIPFADYNPNKLFQFCLIVQNLVMNIIVEEMYRVIPHSLMRTKEEDLQTRYAREFGNLLNRHFAKNPLVIPEDATTDAQATAFIKAIERPLMSYISDLLTNSGLSVVAIKEMFTSSDALVLYNHDPKYPSDRFMVPGTTINYCLRYNPKPEMNLRAVFEAEARDIMTISSWDPEVKDADGNPVTPTKSVISNIGKALHSFFTSMVVYTMNVHIQNTLDPNYVQPEPTTEEAEPETPEEAAPVQVDADEGIETTPAE